MWSEISKIKKENFTNEQNKISEKEKTRREVWGAPKKTKQNKKETPVVTEEGPIYVRNDPWSI